MIPFLEIVGTINERCSESIEGKNLANSPLYDHLLHGPSMFAVKAKIYGVLYKQSSSMLLMKHLVMVIGQRLKTPNFSAFHWSPRGSLVSIGQHFVDTRLVHLPKSTETSLITESDQSGPDHQLLQLCDSDQAVRAVHSCNSWFG